MSRFSAELWVKLWLLETKNSAARSLLIPSGEPATAGQFYFTKSPKAVVKIHKEPPKTIFILKLSSFCCLCYFFLNTNKGRRWGQSGTGEGKKQTKTKRTFRGVISPRWSGGFLPSIQDTKKSDRSHSWSPSAFCLQRSDEGREGVKFKGAVCTGIDSLSGVPPSLQIDLKIVDNHTDGSALGTSHTALRTRAHANTLRPQSLEGVGVFIFSILGVGVWGVSLQPSWSSTRILIEKLMQKNQLASSLVSDRLRKAWSKPRSDRCSPHGPQPPHSFVYGVHSCRIFNTGISMKRQKKRTNPFTLPSHPPSHFAPTRISERGSEGCGNKGNAGRQYLHFKMT